jgi:hypothetical protein
MQTQKKVKLATINEHPDLQYFNVDLNTNLHGKLQYVYLSLANGVAMELEPKHLKELNYIVQQLHKS